MANASVVFWVDVDNNALLSAWGSNSTATTPTFKDGDNFKAELHLVKKYGQTQTEVPTAGATFKLAIGNADSKPTAGKWILAYGSSEVEFDYNETALSVQTSLNLIPEIIADGGVTVALVNAMTYRISFNEKQVVSSIFSTDASNLIPSSTVTAGQVKVGSSSVRSVWHIKLKQIPIAYQSTWVAQDACAITVSTIQAGTTRVSILPSPKDGTFILLKDGISTNSLAITATEAEMVAVLGDNFSVKKTGTYAWDITQTSETLVAITADGSGLISFDSVVGDISLNNYETTLLLNGATSVTTYLEIEMTVGSTVSTILQTSCKIISDVIDESTYAPIPFDNPVSINDVNTIVNNAVNNLVDGATDALNTLQELATAIGNDADFATNISTAIGGKLAKSENLSDLADVTTARTNLGLGSMSLETASDYLTTVTAGTTYAPIVHGHAQSDITDLTTDLGLKSPLESPAFTGVPTAPTATVGTDTDQIATTAFVLANSSTAPINNFDPSYSDPTVEALLEGAIAFGNNPSQSNPFATQQDVLTQVANVSSQFGSLYLPLVGGTMTGAIISDFGNGYTSTLSDNGLGASGGGVNSYFEADAIGFSDTAGSSRLTALQLYLQDPNTGGEIFVTANGLQGVASITFGDSTVQTTAYSGVLCLPLAGGVMTGNIYFDGTSGQYIGKGTFDTSRGGNYGISLVCSVGYEFNWQAGWLAIKDQSNQFTPLNIDGRSGLRVTSDTDVTDNIRISPLSLDIYKDDVNVLELGDWGLGVVDSSNGNRICEFTPFYAYVKKDGSGTTIDDIGITFPDGSTQTTAPVSPDLSPYATIASPTFTGTVTIPSGASISGFAPLSSPSFTNTPLAPTASAGTNTTQIATTAFVGTAVANLVASAPTTLDTLNELATALGNDPSFSTTIATSIGGKLAKTSNLSDLSNTTTARSNLGLGTMAVASASDYSTTTVANGLYYPISSNPSSYLTSASLTGYATQTYVTSQGYITSSALTPYLTSATASSTYQTQAGMSLYAPLANPALTGVPTAPTATTGDSSTTIATTAFVANSIIAGSAHAETLQALVRNNTGSSLPAFTVVYISGAVGNKASVAKAQGNSESTSSGTFAITETAIANNADGNVISAGVLSNVDTSAFADGDKLYLSPTVAGAVTTTKPSAPNHLVYIGVVTRSHPNLGTVSVRIQNGYELEELHNVAIASVADKDSLFYESSTSLWKNYTPANARTNLGLGSASTLASSAVVQTANNLSDVTASSARTNLGLGTMAVATASNYLAKADNLSGLADTPTARTNLGLGTASTLASSAVVQTANNLSDVTASTARTNLGLTTVATASFATNAETITGTSTTTVVTPDDLRWWQGRSTYFPVMATIGGSWAQANAGTGFLADQPMAGARRVLSSSTQVVGTAVHSVWIATTSKGTNIGNGCLNWGKAVSFSFRLTTGNVSSDANSVGRVCFGKVNGTAGDLSTKGVGLRIIGGTAYYQLMVHDGTTLTVVNSSKIITQSASTIVDFRITSDALGNAKLYADDVLVASTTGAPTTQTAGSASQSYATIEAQNLAILSSGILQFYVINMAIEWAN